MDGIFGARGKGFYDFYMSVHSLEKQLVSISGRQIISSPCRAPSKVKCHLHVQQNPTMVNVEGHLF